MYVCAVQYTCRMDVRFFFLLTNVIGVIFMSDGQVYVWYQSYYGNNGVCQRKYICNFVGRGRGELHERRRVVRGMHFL